jgi:hypothetical protein
MVTNVMSIRLNRVKHYDADGTNVVAHFHLWTNFFTK